MDTTLYAYPGEHVRLLVRGRHSHSLTGIVADVTPSQITFKEDTSSKLRTVPREAIVTIEVESLLDGVPHWATGNMPPSLSEVLAPLGQMLLTGSGAIPVDLTERHLTSAIATCETAESALILLENRKLVSKVHQALGIFARLSQSDDFEKLSRLRDSSLALCDDIRNECLDDVSRMPVANAAGHLKTLVERKWRHKLAILDPKPRFSSTAGTTRVSIGVTGEVDLPLRIQTGSPHAPATDILVLFDDSPEISHLTKAPTLGLLNPGETRVLRSRIVLTHTLAFRESTITVRAQMRYRTPSGENHTSPKQTLQYTLVPESQFETIPNPYIAYAGGSAVADPNMFFGRTGLVTSLVEQLREGPLGSGFSLYGQKRSGKTSVIEQIRRLTDEPPVIVVSVSFGMLDRRQLTASFARAVLNQVRVSLVGELSGPEYGRLERMWPRDERIDARPIESLQSALVAGRKMLSRRAGWAGLRYVFLFDEFTYLFEVLRSEDYSAAAREDIREFMRQWKALLESRTFSCIVVGQDTMPMFMQRFANEFSSMAPKRLGYLDLAETGSLADKPILTTSGRSRYTGYSLENIFGWTRGHPFFTQVLCDRIVQMANDRKKAEITESDVDDALESLVEGPQRLDPFRFDCLLTADNTGLIALRDAEAVVEERFDPEADYLYSVLSSIAHLSGASNSYVDMQEVVRVEDDKLLIQDLLMREVLEQDGGVRIRVPLFSEYLRRVVS